MNAQDCPTIAAIGWYAEAIISNNVCDMIAHSRSEGREP